MVIEGGETTGEVRHQNAIHRKCEVEREVMRKRSLLTAGRGPSPPSEKGERSDKSKGEKYHTRFERSLVGDSMWGKGVCGARRAWEKSVMLAGGGDRDRLLKSSSPSFGERSRSWTGERDEEGHTGTDKGRRKLVKELQGEDYRRACSMLVKRKPKKQNRRPRLHVTESAGAP